MGNTLSCCIRCIGEGGAWSPRRRGVHREITLLVLGLDGAGKSTVLANLIGEETEDMTPTIGFANATTTLGNSHVTLYDVGGGPRIRGIWKNYYSQSHGLIFVVDASSPTRLDEAKQVLSTVLQEERVRGKPLLIFANKQDQEGAMSEDEVKARLALDSLPQGQNARVVGCTGLCSAGEESSRQEIVMGVGWAVREVRERWEELHERVCSDGEKQRERQEREREERRERVRKIREERERVAALQREQKGDTSHNHEKEEDDDVIPANPFRPISQVVAEATEREARAKREKKAVKGEAVKEQVTASNTTDDKTEDKRTVGETVSESLTPSLPASGGNSEMTESDGQSDAVVHGSHGEGTAPGREGEGTAPGRDGEGTTPGRDGKGTAPGRDGEGTVSSGHSEVHVSSGLSDSTDTLTQVTQDDEASLSSESLGPVTTPATKSVAMATTQQQQTVDACSQDHFKPVQAAVTKKSRYGFLSRLRSRNKISPSTQPLSATTSAEPPTPPPDTSIVGHSPPSSGTDCATEQMNRCQSAEKVGEGGGEKEVLEVGNGAHFMVYQSFRGADTHYLPFKDISGSPSQLSTPSLPPPVASYHA